jgi:polysaccharide deacetylase family protein (PEP-CTERM system associated)
MKTNKKSITIDVEEYFQVEAFAKNITINNWKNFESRIEYQMSLLLEIFQEKNIKATFFILGYIAKNHPNLIKKIAVQGHEIASHGFNHQHITKITRTDFINDIIDSKALLEDLISSEIVGYRAPCFSISPDNHWAHDEILYAGYQYSSSTYPIVHDFYGVPNAPRTPYYLSNGLLEIPISTCEKNGKTKPAGGGGFFRLLPYWLFKKRLLLAYKQTDFVNFYTHPWEYDPEQPKIKSSFKSNFRHRVNQKTALEKLAKLCDDFEFNTLKSIHLDKSYPILGNWHSIANKHTNTIYEK